MKLGKTTLIHFGSQIVVSIAGFIATFAIVRLLSATHLGVYAVAVAVVFWANIPAVSVGNAIKKRVSTGGGAGRYLFAGATLVSVPAVLIVGGLLVIPETVDAYLTRQASGLKITYPLAPLLAAIIVSTMIFNLLTQALQGEGRVGSAGVMTAIERILRTGLQVTLILTGVGVAGLFFGHLVSMLVGAGVVLLLLGARLGRPSRNHIESLYKYARYSWLGAVETRAFAWMDTIVLGLFVNRELIGVYEVSWSLASVLALVAVSVRSTLFPELSELAEQGNHERIRHFLDEGMMFTGMFIIPGLFGAAIVGRRVLRIYDPVFQQGFVILLVLILARGLAAYGKQFVNVINALDRPDVAFRINTVFLIANLTLNLLLVWQFGWTGAAVATMLSAAVIPTLGYRALTGLIGRPSVPLSEIGRQVLAAGLMTVTLRGVAPVAPSSHYGTVLLVGIGVVAYTVSLLLLSRRVREKVRSLALVAN